MQADIDLLLGHPLGALLGYFTVAILGLVISLSLFEMRSEERRVGKECPV